MPIDPRYADQFRDLFAHYTQHGFDERGMAMLKYLEEADPNFIGKLRQGMVNARAEQSLPDSTVADRRETNRGALGTDQPLFIDDTWVPNLPSLAGIADYATDPSTPFGAAFGLLAAGNPVGQTAGDALSRGAAFASGQDQSSRARMNLTQDILEQVAGNAPIAPKIDAMDSGPYAQLAVDIAQGLPVIGAGARAAFVSHGNPGLIMARDISAGIGDFMINPITGSVGAGASAYAEGGDGDDVAAQIAAAGGGVMLGRALPAKTWKAVAGQVAGQVPIDAAAFAAMEPEIAAQVLSGENLTPEEREVLRGQLTGTAINAALGTAFGAREKVAGDRSLALLKQRVQDSGMLELAEALSRMTPEEANLNLDKMLADQASASQMLDAGASGPEPAPDLTLKPGEQAEPVPAQPMASDASPELEAIRAEVNDAVEHYKAVIENIEARTDISPETKAFLKGEYQRDIEAEQARLAEARLGKPGPGPDASQDLPPELDNMVRQVMDPDKEMLDPDLFPAGQEPDGQALNMEISGDMLDPEVMRQKNREAREARAAKEELDERVDRGRKREPFVRTSDKNSDAKRGWENVLQRIVAEQHLEASGLRKDAAAGVDRNVARGVEDFLRNYAGKYLDDVAISFPKSPRGAGGSESTVRGRYNFANSLVEIFKGVVNGNPTETIVHEVFHALSRVVPQEDIKPLHKQYRAERDAYIKKNPHFVWMTERTLLSPDEYRLYREEHPDAPELAAVYKPSSPGDKVRRIEGYKPAYTEENYRFSQFDEWFAEKFKDFEIRRQGERAESSHSLFKHTMNVIKSMFRGLKSAIGRDAAEKTFRKFLKQSYDPTPVRDTPMESPLFGRGKRGATSELPDFTSPDPETNREALDPDLFPAHEAGPAPVRDLAPEELATVQSGADAARQADPVLFDMAALGYGKGDILARVAYDRATAEKRMAVGDDTARLSPKEMAEAITRLSHGQRDLYAPDAESISYLRQQVIDAVKNWRSTTSAGEASKQDASIVDATAKYLKAKLVSRPTASIENYLNDLSLAGASLPARLRNQIKSKVLGPPKTRFQEKPAKPLYSPDMLRAGMGFDTARYRYGTELEAQAKEALAAGDKDRAESLLAQATEAKDLAMPKQVRLGMQEGAARPGRYTPQGFADMASESVIAGRTSPENWEHVVGGGDALAKAREARPESTVKEYRARKGESLLKISELAPLRAELETRYTEAKEAVDAKLTELRGKSLEKARATKKQDLEAAENADAALKQVQEAKALLDTALEGVDTDLGEANSRLDTAYERLEEAEYALRSGVMRDDPIRQIGLMVQEMPPGFRAATIRSAELSGRVGKALGDVVPEMDPNYATRREAVIRKLVQDREFSSVQQAQDFVAGLEKVKALSRVKEQVQTMRASPEMVKLRQDALKVMGDVAGLRRFSGERVAEGEDARTESLMDTVDKLMSADWSEQDAFSVMLSAAVRGSDPFGLASRLARNKFFTNDERAMQRSAESGDVGAAAALNMVVEARNHQEVLKTVMRAGISTMMRPRPGAEEYAYSREQAALVADEGFELMKYLEGREGYTLAKLSQEMKARKIEKPSDTRLFHLVKASQTVYKAAAPVMKAMGFGNIENYAPRLLDPWVKKMIRDRSPKGEAFRDALSDAAREKMISEGKSEEEATNGARNFRRALMNISDGNIGFDSPGAAIAGALDMYVGGRRPSDAAAVAKEQANASIIRHRELEMIPEFVEFDGQKIPVLVRDPEYLLNYYADNFSRIVSTVTTFGAGKGLRAYRLEPAIASIKDPNARAAAAEAYANIALGTRAFQSGTQIEYYMNHVLDAEMPVFGSLRQWTNAVTMFSSAMLTSTSALMNFASLAPIFADTGKDAVMRSLFPGASKRAIAKGILDLHESTPPRPRTETDERIYKKAENSLSEVFDGVMSLTMESLQNQIMMLSDTPDSVGSSGVEKIAAKGSLFVSKWSGVKAANEYVNRVSSMAAITSLEHLHDLANSDSPATVKDAEQALRDLDIADFTRFRNTGPTLEDQIAAARKMRSTSNAADMHGTERPLVMKYWLTRRLYGLTTISFAMHNWMLRNMDYKMVRGQVERTRAEGRTPVAPDRRMARLAAGLAMAGAWNELLDLLLGKSQATDNAIANTAFKMGTNAGYVGGVPEGLAWGIRKGDSPYMAAYSSVAPDQAPVALRFLTDSFDAITETAKVISGHSDTSDAAKKWARVLPVVNTLGSVLGENRSGDTMPERFGDAVGDAAIAPAISIEAVESAMDFFHTAGASQAAARRIRNGWTNDRISAEERTRSQQ